MDLLALIVKKHCHIIKLNLFLRAKLA